jgi:DNA-binding transcriptional LysR family regulator
MTPRQQEYAAAVKEHGGVVAAARALGVHHSVISRTVTPEERHQAG